MILPKGEGGKEGEREREKERGKERGREGERERLTQSRERIQLPLTVAERMLVVLLG